MANASPQPSATAAPPTADTAIAIRVDLAGAAHPISPLIYGLNGAPANTLAELRPAINRWGGNPSTRYNWKLGNAWNSGSDWQYRNGNYGYSGPSASDDFVRDSLNARADVIVTLPTLGWVAKNDDNNTCSFPEAGGGCGDAAKANCTHPGAQANPTLANVASNVGFISEWANHLLSRQKFNVRFFALDNEPDLWGYTHYDVHPACTTYDEIRDKYIEYATAVREIAPQAEILGPVSCCWYFYWNSAAGDQDRAKHNGQEFLPWFLQQVRDHDQQLGKRTLDVLDIHYYPEGLYNDNSDPETAVHRLRSTRSLWDKTYTDESWINQPVYLIPRMKQLIAENYPGTKLGITEWNWGADKTVNGALALADVLGIFGREDLYLANYWRYPEANSPGFFAFKLFTNYDGQGGHFGDSSIEASSTAPEQISSYAALNSTDRSLTLMLINKDTTHDLPIRLDLLSAQAYKAMLYRYSDAAPSAIVSSPLDLGSSPLVLPANSISLVVLQATK